jgi:hypothetical protein
MFLERPLHFFTEMNIFIKCLVDHIDELSWVVFKTSQDLLENSMGLQKHVA